LNFDCIGCGAPRPADRRAADAELVRIALNQAGSPRGQVWAGTVHDALGITDDELAQANVLVSRRFEEPVALEEIQAAEHAGASCLLTHRVQRVRTYLSADRWRMISLYQAARRRVRAPRAA